MAFHNYGELPALDVVSRINITLDNIPTLAKLTDLSADEVTKMRKRLLLPDDDIILHAYIPFEQYEKILDGEHKLYVIFQTDFTYSGGGTGYAIYVAQIHPNTTHSHVTSQAG